MAAVPAPLLLDDAIEAVDRGAHVAKALTVRHQSYVAPDRVQLALEIVDAPAIVTERRDGIAPIDLRDLVRDHRRVSGIPNG